MFFMTTMLAACTLTASAADTAASVLARARHALGMDNPAASVLRVNARVMSVDAYQSERVYPPYLTSAYDHITWLDPMTGSTRDSMTTAFGQSLITLADDHSAWSPQFASWAGTERERNLEPRLVVHAWSEARDVRAVGRCRYRDYERIVLARTGPYGPEQLFVDPTSGFIVKLDRIEPQYLWGQVHVEYLYMTWFLVGAGNDPMPMTSTRLVDGAEDMMRAIMDVTRVPRDSSPAFAMPDTGRAKTVEIPGFMRPTPLDTVRLGPQAFVLENPGYNEVVALVHDTVYVLDATQGEARARADSAWIGKLFPGSHPIVLVVTDLAWPHVAGLRFWVASGATVISRDMSRTFLESVVARHWRLHPDKLESLPNRPSLKFRGVERSYQRDGIGLYAIDGEASEGALMAFLPADGVLYASDYFQTVQAPALYTTEVYAAACRFGLAPARVLAEHQPVVAWSVLTQLVQQQPIADYPVACR